MDDEEHTMQHSRPRGVEMLAGTVWRSAGLTVCLMLVVLTRGYATPHWEWVNPLPQGHGLVSIAANAGIVVAVGMAGTIMTSTDGGGSWSVRATSSEYELVDIVWGGGRYVAVGGQVGEEFRPDLGVILTSSDGLTWVERHRVQWMTLGGVCWNGTRFVAVGHGGKVLTSTTGVTWQEHNLPSEMWLMRDIVWTGSQFVSLGLENWFEGGRSVFVSSDGIDWERLTLPDPEGAAPVGVVAADGDRLVVPWSEGVLVGNDGISWERVHVAGLYAERIEFLNDRFIAVGLQGLVATSPDGYAWSIEHAPTTRLLSGMTWDGEQWIVVGDHGVILCSSDAVSWEQVGADAFDLGSSSLRDLTWGGGRFVGVGDNAVVLASSNGVQWERAGAPAYDLQSVSWIDGAFWAVGRAGDVLATSDGLSWHAHLRDPSMSFYDLTYGDSVFVVVGRDETPPGYPVVATSTDGGQWSLQTFASEGAFIAVEWTGERFVAVGTSGLVATSSNGTDWESSSIGSEIVFQDVAWSGHGLVAFAQGQLAVSRTGQYWELLPYQEELGLRPDITWTGDCFVVPGRDGILTSADGQSWTFETSGTALGLTTTAADDQQLIAMGLEGTIIRRAEPPRCLPRPRNPGQRLIPAEKEADVHTGPW